MESRPDIALLPAAGEFERSEGEHESQANIFEARFYSLQTKHAEASNRARFYSLQTKYAEASNRAYFTSASAQPLNLEVQISQYGLDPRVEEMRNERADEHMRSQRCLRSVWKNTCALPQSDDPKVSHQDRTFSNSRCPPAKHDQSFLDKFSYWVQPAMI